MSQPVNNLDGFEDDHSRFIDELLLNTPQEWEASEGSEESIAIDYVRALERRLTALGGSLLPHVEHPNPVRTLESHGVEDQTSERWEQKKSCPTNRSLGPDPKHHMISIRTFSPSIPYVEQCTDCGWVDSASLQWWADDAVKKSLSARGKRIAVAAEAEPFSFVAAPEQDLTIEEVTGQALGAASMCWQWPESAGIFDSSRAAAVYSALAREVEAYAARERKEATDLAYELYALACNSASAGHATAQDWQDAFELLRERFHALLRKDPDHQPGKGE